MKGVNNITMIWMEFEQEWFVNVGHTGITNEKKNELIRKQIIWLQGWVSRLNKKLDKLES